MNKNKYNKYMFQVLYNYNIWTAFREKYFISFLSPFCYHLTIVSIIISRNFGKIEENSMIYKYLFMFYPIKNIKLLKNKNYKIGKQYVKIFIVV